MESIRKIRIEAACITDKALLRVLAGILTPMQHRWIKERLEKVPVLETELAEAREALRVALHNLKILDNESMYWDVSGAVKVCEQALAPQGGE